MAAEGYPQVHPETREAWRAWLAEHHAASKGVWLVTWKKHTGKPAMTYDEAVEEALCFGWVDSLARGLDEDRSMLLYTPRRAASGSSRPNKERVARLIADGRMQPAGLRMVELAKASGTWTALDAVERLEVPDDLAAALRGEPAAQALFDALSAQNRYAVLHRVTTAQRPPTRARRIEQYVAMLARGETPYPQRGS